MQSTLCFYDIVVHLQPMQSTVTFCFYDIVVHLQPMQSTFCFYDIVVLQKACPNMVSEHRSLRHCTLRPV